MTVEELKDALKDVPDYYEITCEDWKVESVKELNSKQVINMICPDIEESVGICEHYDRCMHYEEE